MHRLAEAAGVPLKNIQTIDLDVSLPGELAPIHDTLLQKIQAGDDQPVLSKEQNNMLKQRYLHHSDHYNLAESLIGDTITAFEIPFSALMPFRPTIDRKRVVHTNAPEVTT